MLSQKYLQMCCGNTVYLALTHRGIPPFEIPAQEYKKPVFWHPILDKRSTPDRFFC